GERSPWVRAFWQATALPSGVRGPVERSAFWRFAVSRAGVAIGPHFITVTVTGSRLDGSTRAGAALPQTPTTARSARDAREHTVLSRAKAPLVARDALGGPDKSTPRRARSPSPWIIPFKAAMLGVPWSVLGALFDERRARHGLQPPRARPRARPGRARCA